MNAEQKIGVTPAVGCPRCHSEVVGGTQFCRSCGFRLFESGVPAPNFAAANMPAAGQWTTAKPRRSGPHWLVWVVVALIMASVVGGGILSSGVRNLRSSITGRKPKPRSYLGIDETSSAGGGAMINAIDTPDGAADKAGLVGGDIITAVNGAPIKSSDDYSTIMSQIPSGATIDVAFVRDGVAKTTKLTTMAKAEMDSLMSAFNDQKQGYLGVDDYERVQVPGQDIYGVKVDDVSTNRPAYISGLRDGDIVLEMDGIPIRTADEFVQRIHRAKPESVVKFVIMRGAERKEIPVTIGVK
jgi:S1-C subfamily serine protease